MDSEARDRFDSGDIDWNDVSNPAVIKFDRDSRGNVSGKYKGLVVYRHRSYQGEIQAGELWVCNLIRNPNLISNNYFAKPLVKLDPSFLFGLTSDQVGDIAQWVWENHRDTLEPVLEERYREAIVGRVSEALEGQKAQYESRIADLEARVEELSRKAAEDDRIIQSQQRELGKGSVPEPPEAVDGYEPEEEAADTHMGDEGEGLSTEIVRTGPDTLRSNLFMSPRYMVHISADHRLMEVRPSRNGNVVCIDNEIRLYGLGQVVPFTSPYELDYVFKKGLLKIDLRTLAGRSAPPGAARRSAAG